MVRFAQGVFGTATEADRAVDALIALGGYRRYRALLLTLDRMDITRAARLRARRRSGAPHRRAGRAASEQHAVVAFQSSLAIVERARLTRAIDAATAERLRAVAGRRRRSATRPR